MFSGFSERRIQIFEANGNTRKYVEFALFWGHFICAHSAHTDTKKQDEHKQHEKKEAHIQRNNSHFTTFVHMKYINANQNRRRPLSFAIEELCAFALTRSFKQKHSQ